MGHRHAREHPHARLRFPRQSMLQSVFLVSFPLFRNKVSELLETLRNFYANALSIEWTFLPYAYDVRVPQLNTLEILIILSNLGQRIERRRFVIVVRL